MFCWHRALAGVGTVSWDTGMKPGTHCWWNVALFVSCSLKKRFFPFPTRGRWLPTSPPLPFFRKTLKSWQPGMSASAAALSTGPVLEAWAGQGFIQAGAYVVWELALTRWNPISLALIIELTLLCFYPLTVKISISPPASKHWVL